MHSTRMGKRMYAAGCSLHQAELILTGRELKAFYVLWLWDGFKLSMQHRERQSRFVEERGHKATQKKFNALRVMRSRIKARYDPEK